MENTKTDPASSSVAAQTRRLALMFRIGFLLSAAFLAADVVISLSMGRLIEDFSGASHWAHIATTAYLGALAVLMRRAPFSANTVTAIDIGGVLGAVVLLDANALLPGSNVVSVFNVVVATGIVVWLRAVIVPSTIVRTLGVCVAASLGAFAVVVGAVLADPSSTIGAADRGAILAATALWLLGFAACATLTSEIVFGLRQEIRAARQVGAYLLHEKLGEGGMGVVYRATHALLKRETAVKLVRRNRSDSSAIARFEREVVLTAKLSHPNTVAVYDYGRTPEGEFYYAMEYLEGLTLQELVDRCGPVPPGRVVSLLMQVCGSLEEAHRCGLVHRDVKPANIMVTCRASMVDLVKVLDFGLVKDFEHPSTQLSTAALIGTPMTMSPEAIAHPAAISPASDLYALGAVAYFLLTGEQVFDGETLVAVCAQHMYQAPTAPSSRLGRALPADLDALVLNLLAKDPADRPASAAQLRARLGACRDVSPWTEEESSRWWIEIGEPIKDARETARLIANASRTGLMLTIDAGVEARSSSGPYQSNPCLPMNSRRIEVGGT